MPARRILTAAFLLCVAANADEVYRDSNRRFHILIPGNYTLLAGAGRNKNSESYIPVCSDQAEVCALYPKSRFARTNFEAASVEITVLDGSSQQVCDETSKNDKQEDEVQIGGVTFKHFVSGVGASSSLLAQDRFIRLQGGSCFQVNLNIATTSYAAFDAGSIQEFTARDHAKVKSELFKVVRSLQLSR